MRPLYRVFVFESRPPHLKAGATRNCGFVFRIRVETCRRSPFVVSVSPYILRKSSSDGWGIQAWWKSTHLAVLVALGHPEPVRDKYARKTDPLWRAA